MFKGIAHIMLGLLMTLLIVGCDKPKRNNETATAESHLRGMQFSVHNFFVVKEAFYLKQEQPSFSRTSADSLRYFLPNCVSDESQLDNTADNSLESGASYPKVVILDFASDCKTLDGYSSSGSMKIVYDNDFETEGAKASIAIQDFEWRNYLVSGELHYSYAGLRPDNKRPQYNLTVSELEFVPMASRANFFTWVLDGKIEVVEGHETLISDQGPFAQADDVIAFSGSSSGTAINDLPFSAEIETNIRVKASQKEFTQGISQITPKDSRPRKLHSENEVYVVFDDDTEKPLSY